MSKLWILTGTPISDTKAPVQVEYTELGYNDLVAMDSHLLPRLIPVDSKPESDPTQVGKAEIWYINPQTLEMWYEYEVIPLTPEQIKDQRLANLELAMASVLGM